MHSFHFDDQYHTYHGTGRALAPDGQSTVSFDKSVRKLILLTLVICSTFSWQWLIGLNKGSIWPSSFFMC